MALAGLGEPGISGDHFCARVTSVPTAPLAGLWHRWVGMMTVLNAVICPAWPTSPPDADPGNPAFSPLRKVFGLRARKGVPPIRALIVPNRVPTVQRQ